MTVRRWGSLAACVLFGAVVEVLKARGSWAFDLRGELGNLSAPWLVLGLLAGLRMRSLRSGACAGLLVTYAALCGFYLAEAVVFAGHLGDHGGLLADTAWVLRAGLVWFVFGSVAGPGMGAAGAWLRREHPGWAWPAVGLLLVGEPFVLQLFGNRPLPLPAPLDLTWSFHWSGVQVAEVLAGLLVIGAGLPARGAVPRGR